jgi:predicted regulator of Ras-like GTPase activity (Roadblock/LC7/MglB family)
MKSASSKLRRGARKTPDGGTQGETSMVDPQMVMYEEEFNHIQQVCDKLVRDANAIVVFIVDKNGQLIATSGEYEHQFATQFHEGERQNIHIQIVGQRVILVVIFDERSSLGLVRLRVRKANEELNRIFESLLAKVQDPGTSSPFAEITDDDIDNLFND